MADTMRAAFSQANAALFICFRATGVCDDRNTFYGSIGAQSAAGVGAPLVLPQPFPRHARPAALCGMPRRLIRAFTVTNKHQAFAQMFCSTSERTKGRPHHSHFRETVVLFRDIRKLTTKQRGQG
jgi:hypothetical protein